MWEFISNKCIELENGDYISYANKEEDYERNRWSDLALQFCVTTVTGERQVLSILYNLSSV